MADNKLQDDVLHTSNLTAGPDLRESELLNTRESDYTKTLYPVVEPLAFLASVALAPPCGKGKEYSYTGDTCRCLVVRPSHQGLQSVQLQFFISKADAIQKELVAGISDGKGLADSVLSFLYTCQPYFNYLESTARSTVNGNGPLPEPKRSQLLDFSQRLCDRLEKLVLTFVSYRLLCLDESEPDSISHFYIGQCRLGPVKLTMFRYCKPTPYLAQVNTGLYKRMRWNVERHQDMAQQQQQDQAEDEGREPESDSTEYYFLCCEDYIPGNDRDNQSHCSNARMWSIGQWVQLSPDTDDINDWILCEIPKGKYQRLLYLGTEEPSCNISTDYLMQLLLSKHKE